MKKYYPENESAENFEEERELQGMADPSPSIQEEGKFTKGEWEVYERFPGAWSVGVNPNEPEKLIPIASLFKNEEAEANAALIADCPNMKKYIDYVFRKVSLGSVPYDYEDWKEVGKPDYE